MRLGVLGPLLLETVEGTAVSLGRGQRALLAALALDRRRVWTPDELADAVWGEKAGPTAPRLIRNRVSELRTRHGRGLVETIGDGYRLGEVVRLDLDRLAEVRQPEVRLALWRGVPFADLTDWPLARSTVESLRVQLLDVEEDAVASALAAGRIGDAVSGAERLVVEEPYRERRWELLAHARYVSAGQHGAIDACQRARTILRDDLGLDPGPRLVAMEERILRHDPSLSDTVRQTAPPWPPNRLIGRADDLDRVNRALAEHRLVTLVGLGGIGKTRLAIELAHAETEAVFVDLAGVVGPDVLHAVARPAGLPVGPDELTALTAWATAFAGVIVIDNAEAVATEAGAIAQMIVDAGARVRILATSRIPLGAPREHVISLGPLAPEMAVELFDVCASHHHDPTAVAKLCQAVDRLPLAIELTASLAEVIDPNEILQARASLGAVTDVVRWSIEALSPAGSALLASASVLPAPFLFDAVDHLHGGPNGAGVLAELVRHSLLEVQFGSRTRYRMLDLVREEVGSLLGLAAGRVAARQGCVKWAVSLAESLEYDTMYLNVPDLPNLAASHDIALADGDVDAAVRIAMSHFHFHTVGRMEPVRWAEATLGTAGVDAHPLHGILTGRTAWVLAVHGRFAEAAAMAEVAIGTEPDGLGAGWGRAARARVTGDVADFDRAVLVAIRGDDPFLEILARVFLTSAIGAVDPAVKRAHADAAYRRALELGETWAMMLAENALGQAVVDADREACVRHLNRTRELAESIGNEPGVVATLVSLLRLDDTPHPAPLRRDRDLLRRMLACGVQHVLPILLRGITQDLRDADHPDESLAVGVLTRRRAEELGGARFPQASLPESSDACLPLDELAVLHLLDELVEQV